MASLDCTQEDMTVIKEAVLIPIILDVLERDIKVMMASTLKMKEVYARQLRKLQNEVLAANAEIKKQMRKLGLKIYEENRDKERISAKFLCRSYHHDFSMYWSYVKSEIQVRLCGYMGIDIGDETLLP